MKFRCRHEQALGELFSGVLGLCARAGLGSVGIVSVDGTKLAANASIHANRDFGQVAREILRDAAETDRREDEIYGQARGDELPEHLRTREGRRKALREAKQQLEQEQDAGEEQVPAEEEPLGPNDLKLDPAGFVTKPEGRRAWVREGRRALDARRAEEARPIPAERTDRLFDACHRLEEELDAENASHAAYEAWRLRGIAADGSRRMATGMVKPHEPVTAPAGLVNLTDLDSRVVKSHGREPVQGYNAQLAVNEQQVILAAEILTYSPDFGQLEPMIDAARRELTRNDLGAAEVVLADAGYWHQRQMESLTADGIQVLVPPDGGRRPDIRPGWTGGLYTVMRDALKSDAGRELYRHRQTTVEPVFGQIKFNRSITRFQRRGRAACRSEWRLIAATHNLLKLHSHRIATA